MDSEARKKGIYKVTMVGSGGNLLLTLFKFIAGLLGHSSAMIADAVHSLSDFATDIVVIIFVRISSKPSDAEHRYGHGKYETLATIIIALMLFIVGAGILWKGAEEIYAYLKGDMLEAPGIIALIAALVSIVIKEGLYHYTRIAGRQLGSKAVEANAWHHRSDAFSSIGTAIGVSGAIFLGVKWRVLDPIAAVVVSLFIIKAAWSLFKPALDELLERSLPQQTESQIMDVLKSIPSVYDPHNLRTRRIGNYAAVDVHVRMNPNMTVAQSHEITKVIEQKIKHLLGEDAYVTVHVEPIKTLANSEQRT